MKCIIHEALQVGDTVMVCAAYWKLAISDFRSQIGIYFDDAAVVLSISIARRSHRRDEEEPRAQLLRATQATSCWPQ